MKDATSTPTTEGSSRNQFERGKPGTNARSDAEAAIEELRQRGGVFVDAVRATRMPMVLSDPNLPGNPIVFANEAFLKLSGYSMDDVLGQHPHFMNGPDTDRHDAARFAEAVRSDQDDIIETIQYGKDGSPFVATVLVSAFKDDQGRTLNHFMSWLDVTRRVAAEAEISELRQTQEDLRESERHSQTLLAELQHRVRNSLAVVRSIARRTAENSTSVDEMLAHFQGRLDAFSRVQAKLTRTADARVDLMSLVEDELIAHAAREGEQVRIEGAKITLEPKLAERLSLAVHELATNAVKHGALGGDGGKVAIAWKRGNGADGASLHFSWEESGVEIDDKPTREGFGMDLLLRSLPYDLHAETRVDFRPQGLRFDLTMPLNGAA